MSASYRGVKEAFDATANDYDRLRRQLIPCFDDYYGMVGRLMPFGPEDAADVLDLGAGTGLLTAILRGQFPNVHFTLIDISDEMLAKARERFAGQDVRLSSVTTRASPYPAPSTRSSRRYRSTT
jgi:tRNA (cmo5U34)-methyltransferase